MRRESLKSDTPRGVNIVVFDRHCSNSSEALRLASFTTQEMEKVKVSAFGHQINS